MTTATIRTPESTATWAGWAEASEIQRAHFKTLPQHKAWSRLCAGCGQGDYLERKQMPTSDDAGLQGRGFPSLPEPIVEGGRTQRYRTPAHRVHSCTPVARR